jgi:hypothetical protein
MQRRQGDSTGSSGIGVHRSSRARQPGKRCGRTLLEGTHSSCSGSAAPYPRRLPDCWRVVTRPDQRIYHLQQHSISGRALAVSSSS